MVNNLNDIKERMQELWRIWLEGHFHSDERLGTDDYRITSIPLADSWSLLLDQMSPDQVAWVPSFEQNLFVT